MSGGDKSCSGAQVSHLAFKWTIVICVSGIGRKLHGLLSDRERERERRNCVTFAYLYECVEGVRSKASKLVGSNEVEYLQENVKSPGRKLRAV